MQFLVSAGEASGDLYAAGVVSHLKDCLPGIAFFGCAGPRLQAQGVSPVIDAASLAVVGLAEVVHHLPRIYGEYRKLVRSAYLQNPVGALLTDSPDFHLRLARHLKRSKIPVFYLVAPQVWAWRSGRVKMIRSLVDQLFCLFPFEEKWFRDRGVDATYIGHPLARMVQTTVSKTVFFTKHHFKSDRRTIVLLPGSRSGEALRHMPILLDAVAKLRQQYPLNVVLATPKGFRTNASLQKYREPLHALAIKVVDGETWDCIGHSDLALAASGTVTMEAALLGTPMVTFYKVSPLTWHAGRHLVKAPFLSMVNLIAERAVVPELIQMEMTGSTIAEAAISLLSNQRRCDRMRSDLAEIRRALTVDRDPLEFVAARIVQGLQVRPFTDQSSNLHAAVGRQ